MNLLDKLIKDKNSSYTPKKKYSKYSNSSHIYFSIKKFYLRNPEMVLQKQCFDYISGKYPELNSLFIFNSLQGLYLDEVQRAIAKQTGGLKENLLDFELKLPRNNYIGLALELKKETPYKKNGDLRKDTHLENQFKTIQLLQAYGWKAEFVWTFEQFKTVLDSYLKREVEYQIKK